MADRVWHLGYSSNLDVDRLRRYLPDSETDGRYAAGLDTRWVQLDSHRLYFVGTSKTWGGAVSFCALVPQPTRPYPGKAYALSPVDLALVVGKENGRRPIAARAGGRRRRRDQPRSRRKVAETIGLTDDNHRPVRVAIPLH